MPRPYIPSLTGALALGFSAATLAATAIPGPLNLGEVKINAQSLITDNATTEGSGSYTTGAMSTAVGLPLSIRETPQSVSVITRQRMDDQGMNDLNDVVK